MTIAATPTFDFYKRFRALAYLLIVLAVAGFSYAENNPIGLFLILAAAAISWIVVEGPRGKALPRPIVNVGVLATASILFYELVFESDGSRDPGPNLLLALGHFMTGILICKLFERKTHRDYGQIFTLTLLIMVAAAIFSASLLFACILVAYLSLALYALMLLHLRAETEGAVTAHLLPADRSSLADVFLKRDIRRVTTWSMLFLAAIAVAVFLFVPRTRGQGLLNAWSADSTFRTGYSDHIRFHDYGQLQLSDAIVMEVKLEQDGANIGSEYLQPYFRGITLDTYDSVQREWIHSDRYQSSDYDLIPGEMTQLISPDHYNAIGLITQQYILRANVGNTFFTISPPVLASADTRSTIAFTEGDYAAAVRGVMPPNLHYTVTSALIARDDSHEPALVPLGELGPADSFGGGIEEISVVPTRVRQLARDIIKDILPQGELLTPERIRPVAERFEEYLRTNYPYSLTFEAKDPTIDPTADFLLNRKDTGGHCEYFASAMVMLCRSVGINSRVVTGYHGGDFNSISGYYVVRQKYAHAWAEVYMPGRGWVLSDPSPAAGDVTTPSSFPHWFRDIGEILQKNWLSSIVGFDNSSRSYIFDAISNFFESVSAVIHDNLDDLRLSFDELLFSRNSPWSERFIGGGTTLFILGMTFWLTYRWNRRRTSPIGHMLRKVDRKIQRQLSQELLFFDELLRVLARTGSRKRAEQTPREYVEKLAPVLRNAASDARWLVATFYDIRFGATHITAALRSQIAAALSNVRHELHRHPKISN